MTEQISRANAACKLGDHPNAGDGEARPQASALGHRPGDAPSTPPGPRPGGKPSVPPPGPGARCASLALTPQPGTQPMFSLQNSPSRPVS